MPTIQIADDPHPRQEQTERRDSRTSSWVADVEARQRLRRSRTTESEDGIYNIRSKYGAPLRRSTTLRSKDDDPGIRREGDFKHKQVFSGKVLLWLAYQSIGVIYGDIGTSPLYVYSGTFTEPPSREDLLGVLSLVIWSLLVMVTLKYVFIILRADNNGEGGTFSTYALLSRYLNITKRDPREASLIEMKRHMSGDLESTNRHMRRGLEHSKFARGLLKVIGVLAVTMVMADGVLTPAQSVLGAVQGIEVVAPNISKSTIIGVTDAILVVLFLLQPLGITKLTVAFSPVIIIWLGFNAVFGAYNLVHYDAGVFKAFNPGYAFLFLIHRKKEGWKQLGGVLLCFTGLEALFADLGAFSRRAIQISWLFYTLPCILLAYIGQAAYISVHPDAYDNPFFNAAPPGTIYPALVIAILAAIVASQAIITATFQLLAQVMKLSYFPQIKVVHTSETFHGQLYVPVANILLCIGSVLVASIYNNTTSLGNAYGTCVMFVTFFDTCMVTLVALFVWRIRYYLVIVPFLTIAAMDGTFLSSALLKVPVGAWFTIMLSGILASFLLLWRFGKEQQWAAEAEDRFPTSHFVTHHADGALTLSDRFDNTPVSATRGLGIYFDKAGETTPIVFSQFVLKLTAIPDVSIFFHLRPLETPHVAPEDRHTVSRLAIPNCYRLVVRYGYNDEIISPNLAGVVYQQVRQYLVAEDANRAQENDSLLPIAGASLEKDTDGSNIVELSEKDPDLIDKRSASLSGTNNDNNATGIPTFPSDPGSLRSRNAAAAAAAAPTTHIGRKSNRLANLDRAYEHKVLYIVGKEQMKISRDTNFLRQVLLWMFLWVRENTRTKMANLKVPAAELIEVGFLKEIS